MAGLRYALSAAGEYLRYLMGHGERRAAFERVAAERDRDRVFLVGNGPSLKAMNLDHLEGEDYLHCNLAERIDWTRGKTHPFYIAADARVPEGFANGVPGIAADHYFLHEALRPGLAPGFAERKDIVWFTGASGGTLHRGLTRTPWVGVPGGQTILLSAAQIALYLGYRQLIVIGCDLNYQMPSPYAYEVSEAERKAYRNEAKMVDATNRAFALLDGEARKRGQSIVNAGIGGNLETLERVDFDGLFQD